MKWTDMFDDRNQKKFLSPVIRTAHYEYCEDKPLPGGVYTAYDPAEDGPECEVITRILASHPTLDQGWQGRLRTLLEILAEARLNGR